MAFSGSLLDDSLLEGQANEKHGSEWPPCHLVSQGPELTYQELQRTQSSAAIPGATVPLRWGRGKTERQRTNSSLLFFFFPSVYINSFAFQSACRVRKASSGERVWCRQKPQSVLIS